MPSIPSLLLLAERLEHRPGFFLESDAGIDMDSITAKVVWKSKAALELRTMELLEEEDGALIRG